MSNLQLRVISSIVLIVAVLSVTWFGGAAFRILCAAIAGAMFYEWCAMSRKPGSARHQWVAAALLAVVLLALVLGYSAASVLVLLVLSALASLLGGRIGGQEFWASAGLAYAGLSGLSLAFLRDGDQAGLLAILFLFAVVWATDSCAYFVGRSLGGPKLAPSISPGKTQSGALGGALGGVLAGMALAAFAGLGNLPMLAVVAFLLSVVSQIGDLFESWVKRRHGVKDSGNLIPGHGGVMDRVDGLVAAAFALYAIGGLLGSADKPAQALFAI
ncbi:phosphatidate cytidylyltransferase [Mesorhizobium sp. KR9-304]|uniref:phosphatidate cytidylyltransferase n=1 Tax=Mesorhizobium sp. KR9-304 TaxID=3156614 RepID=UPI0032B32244